MSADVHLHLGVTDCPDCCEHLSATGVDQTTGPDKVWRCDACGWLYRSVKDRRGISRMVAA